MSRHWFEQWRMIIDRYRRRESSAEEALIEMYLAGVSVRRVEDITEALWG
jgi:putative transposase